VNDDGIIDIVDIVSLAIRFGEEGTPINKTELLLELQDRIDSLNLTLETRVPQKGNISVSATEFTPQSQEHNYTKWINALVNVNTNEYTSFYADVQLPHGATLTNVTFYWYDYGTDFIMCGLARCNEFHTQYIARADSPSTEAPGNSFSYDDILNYATVDNNNYAYVLHVNLPWEFNTYRFKLARIEWEYLP